MSKESYQLGFKMRQARAIREAHENGIIDREEMFWWLDQLVKKDSKWGLVKPLLGLVFVFLFAALALTFL